MGIVLLAVYDAAANDDDHVGQEEVVTAEWESMFFDCMHYERIPQQVYNENLQRILVNCVESVGQKIYAGNQMLAKGQKLVHLRSMTLLVLVDVRLIQYPSAIALAT